MQLVDRPSRLTTISSAGTLASISLCQPRDRYFLLNVPCCSNYKRQLFFDTLTGNYQRLPSDVWVYLTLNTDSNPQFRITEAGVMAE
jgi:hypothetical protein